MGDIKNLVDSAKLEQIIAEYTLAMSHYLSDELCSIRYAHFMMGSDAEGLAYITTLDGYILMIRNTKM